MYSNCKTRPCLFNIFFFKEAGNQSCLKKISPKVPEHFKIDLYMNSQQQTTKITKNNTSSKFFQESYLQYNNMLGTLSTVWSSWLLFPQVHAFFRSQPHCCSTLPWIELQMLLRYCLILGLGLFISYLCDLFCLCSLILVAINHITSFKQTYLFSAHLLEYWIFYYFWMITWMKKRNIFQIAKIQPQGVV